MLNFVYHGKVSVAQEELNSFLAVVEELRVKVYWRAVWAIVLGEGY